MKKHIIIITLAITAILLVVGCKKKEETVTPGSIHGLVSDANSGELIQNASVKLQPKGLQTVTGSDGRYQFAQIDPGQYNLFIEKTGYQSLSHDITVNSGESANGDVRITKLPESLQILDNNGDPVTELNFGGDAGIVSKTFKIYNKGTESFRFEITKYVDWIESITPSSGIIPVNGNCPVVVKINREKLIDGLNTSSIIITSETVGGVELVVKASKNPALLITNNNGSEITELNFGSDANSTQKSFRLRNNKNQKISYTITKTANWISSINPASGELNAGTTATISVIINRELLADGDNSTIILINTPNDGGYELTIKARKEPENGIVELPAANLMVQKIDIGCVSHYSAETMCESSDLGGYTDWRLPNRDELMVLYNNRNLIGNFTTGKYWSSDYYYDSYYYAVNFGTGELVCLISTASYYVRAVRDLIGISTPTVTTSAPSNITASTASCGGNVTSDGGADITERGICLSINPNPNIVNNIVFHSGSGTGLFTINLSNLSNNTTYYVKAYAKNSKGVAYGEEKSFTTDMFPTFQYAGETYQVAPDPGTTMNWENANSYCNNLTLYGLSDWRLPTKDELLKMYVEQNSIGGFDNTYHYYYWSNTNCDNDSYNIVDFSNGSTNCRPNNYSYSLRPIRQVNGGSTTTPSVTTSTPSNITDNSATCGGNVTSDGGATVTARGVCWSTSQNPTISGSHTTDGSGTGSFTSSITGLAENTTYYVRAYATNSIGTAYGEQKTFTTNNGGSGATIPTVTTATPFDIAIYSAACGGNVTSDGGATVFERGICYSTSQNPTTSSYTVQSGSGTGSYTCYMTGLNQSTTYYVRAYAINSEGIAYGSQVSFTTNCDPINGWLYYDNINVVGHAGLNNGGTLYWANMYPPSMLAPYAGTSVVKLEAHLDLTGNYILQIYQGGDNGPSTLLLNDNCYVSSAGGYVTFTFGTPISFDASQNLWVVIGKTHSSGDHPAGYSNLSDDLNSRWCSIDGNNWGDSGYTWILHTYVSNTGEKSGRNLVEIRHTNNDSDIKSTINY